MAFRLQAKRCEEIKEIVVRTFEKLNIRCTPISGFEIATKLGVVIVPYSSKPESVIKLILEESEDGFSVKKDGTWYIFYNDNMRSKKYRRINNTLIHECGHIVLDHTQASELAEAEANFFAKYAIAPPVLIHKLKLKSANDVYDHFDISHEAAKYAFEYYIKWLNYGGEYYKDYEMRLLELFEEAM